MKGMPNLMFLPWTVSLFFFFLPSSLIFSECKTPFKPSLKKVIVGRREMAGRSGSLLRSLRSLMGSSRNAWRRDDAHFGQPHRSFFTINRLFFTLNVSPLRLLRFMLLFFFLETEFGPGFVIVLVAEPWDNWAATTCQCRFRVLTVSH